MSPEALAALMSNPEMMTLLRNPKMQEVMKKVMEEGPGAAESMMNDPELKDMLEKVRAVHQQMSRLVCRERLRIRRDKQTNGQNGELWHMLWHRRGGFSRRTLPLP